MKNIVIFCTGYKYYLKYRKTGTINCWIHWPWLFFSVSYHCTCYNDLFEVIIFKINNAASLCYRKKMNTNFLYFVHINLCISLVLALSVLIVGLETADHYSVCTRIGYNFVK